MTLLRVVIAILMFLSGWLTLHAQRIDSVHVYRKSWEGSISSASANAMVWRLHQQHAQHTTLKGSELASVTETMKTYKPARHSFGKLKDLEHLAMVFSGGRPLAFGVTEDLDVLINFTARQEYHISSFSDHVRVRALLAKLILEH
ncbi:MAG: hypothetical protein M3R08_08025 [Bacteroidota bacterium]|nr:hypothetical protein [Bacteroidota bacterium]